MTSETVWLRLLKIDGWMRERLDQVRLRLASSYPSGAWWRTLDLVRHQAP